SADSTLYGRSEALVMALLGEIGGVELIDGLLQLPGDDQECFLHTQWALFRIGQRFPAEAFARLQAAAQQAGPEARATIAQHLFFLQPMPGVRAAVRDLLDGFAAFAHDEAAPFLLLTVSTLLAMMDAPGDSLEVLKRHERQLSNEGGRLLKR